MTVHLFIAGTIAGHDPPSGSRAVVLPPCDREDGSCKGISIPCMDLHGKGIISWEVMMMKSAMGGVRREERETLAVGVDVGSIESENLGAALEFWPRGTLFFFRS